MGRVKLTECLMFLMVLGLSSCRNVEIPSPMEPTEQCIFTCEQCFEDSVLVQCANECLETDGVMNKEWLPSCPELFMPLFVEVDKKEWSEPKPAMKQDQRKGWRFILGMLIPG